MKFFALLSILSSLLIAQAPKAETIVTKADENVISFYAMNGGRSEILKIVAQKMFESILLRDGYKSVHIDRVGLSTIDYPNFATNTTWMRTEYVYLKKCEPAKVAETDYMPKKVGINRPPETNIGGRISEYVNDFLSRPEINKRRAEEFNKCHDSMGSCWIKLTNLDRARQLFKVELDRSSCEIVNREGYISISVDLEKTAPSTFEMGEIQVDYLKFR